MVKKIALTGDRPTGPLHLGHFVGSLQQRIHLQHINQQYIMIADVQALTDNFEDPLKVRNNVVQVALDYMAVGIDPKISTIFLQSMIPEIAELTIFYLNLVTINRLKRNPTVKTEIAQKGYGEGVTAGFLMYPVHQAADITVFKGQVVPVGEDQLPVIEQTNELVRRFNAIYGQTLVEAEPLISKVPRLAGIDGKAKMSKSLGNAIFLKDSADEIVNKVMKMYTDPNHVHVNDPGKIEGNTVFEYLDVFGTDVEVIQQMKEHYQKGGLGDVKVKRYLIEVLETFIAPIRQRREELEHDIPAIMNVIMQGTEKARAVAAETMREVKWAMRLQY